MSGWPGKTWKRVAFQGEFGAYAHMAGLKACPKATFVPCTTFEDAAAAVRKGAADGVILPVENSTVGRIADIHHLLPMTKLQMVGEVLMPIKHCLLGVKGAKMAHVREVYSQLPALAQCAGRLRKMGAVAVQAADTAGSAKLVAGWNDKTKAALASKLAGELYGLSVLDAEMNDEGHNTTRFVLLGNQAWVPPLKGKVKTSILFRVRDIPAALYKALGGFATNGINLLKLESYVVEGKFEVVQFLVEIDGHVDSEPMRHALDELRFYSAWVRILGCYAEVV